MSLSDAIGYLRPMGDESAALLRSTRRLIARGWTQRADARDRHGLPVEPWAPAAETWSLLGAIVAALEQHAQLTQRELPLSHLAGALDELAGLIEDDSLAAWNDHPGRTQHHVLSVLDAAAGAAATRV